MPDIIAKVDSFDVSKLVNSEYVEFMTKFRDIIATFPTVVAVLQNLINQFDELMVKVNKSLVAELGSSQTVSLFEADKLRDKIHRGLCYFVEAQRCNLDSEVAEAAERVYRVIKRYGTSKLRNGKYDSETALIRNTVTDLTSAEHSADCTKIGVTQWVTDLETTNNAFAQVMEARLSEAAASIDYTTGDVRKEMTPVYREITGAADTMVALNVENAADFAEFITKLNAEIAYKK